MRLNIKSPPRLGSASSPSLYSIAWRHYFVTSITIDLSHLMIIIKWSKLLVESGPRSGRKSDTKIVAEIDKKKVDLLIANDSGTNRPTNLAKIELRARVKVKYIIKGAMKRTRRSCGSLLWRSLSKSSIPLCRVSTKTPAIAIIKQLGQLRACNFRLP